MAMMTFGKQADEKMQMRILDPSFGAGINSYDTAENYPVPPDPQWSGRYRPPTCQFRLYSGPPSRGQIGLYFDDSNPTLGAQKK
jgi:hypothetical protein